MEKEKNKIYLTEQEIDEIANLNGSSVIRYIENMTEEKKQLVMKQYSKERAIRQWMTIAKEKY